MNRKIEILIGMIIVLSLVLFIGIGVFRNSFDDEAVIANIHDAIKNKDLDYLKDHIEIEGKKKESLSQVELENIREILEGNISLRNLKDYYMKPEDNIYLRKKGKEKFIFDKYILVLRPYKLIVESNVPESEVYINDEKVGTFAKDSLEYIYHDLIPGKHSIKVVYKSEYGDLEKTEDYTFFNESGDQVYSSVYLDAEYIDVYSNIDNATLYVNDKDTKISLSDGYKLGPIPIDGSVKIMAKANIDGETYESKKTFIDGYSSYYELFIDYVEPVEEVVEVVVEPTRPVVYQDDNIEGKITSLMQGYQYGMVEAINNANYSYVQNFIEEGSSLNKSQVKLVNHLSSKGTTERLIDYTIHNITKISDTIYEMQVSEQHSIFYSSGTNDTISNTWIYTVVKVGNNVYLRNLRK